MGGPHPFQRQHVGVAVEAARMQQGLQEKALARDAAPLAHHALDPALVKHAARKARRCLVPLGPELLLLVALAGRAVVAAVGDCLDPLV